MRGRDLRARRGGRTETCAGKQLPASEDVVPTPEARHGFVKPHVRVKPRGGARVDSYVFLSVRGVTITRGTADSQRGSVPIRGEKHTL